MDDNVVLHKMQEFPAKQLFPGFVSPSFFFCQTTSFFPNALVGKIMHRMFTCKSFKIIDISIKILKVLLEEKPLISFVAKYDSYALGKQKEYQGN